MYVLCLLNKTLAFDIFGLLNSCRTSNEWCSPLLLKYYEY